jgi:alpha-glucosidase
LDQQLWRQRLDWDEATGQCYYHAYLAEQPDLNWRKPNVQAAMREALRFWLRRGVDGST